jgi:hypothetical protein
VLFFCRSLTFQEPEQKSFSWLLLLDRIVSIWVRTISFAPVVVIISCVENNNNLFGPEKIKENYQENFPVTIAAGTRLGFTKSYQNRNESHLFYSFLF